MKKKGEGVVNARMPFPLKARGEGGVRFKKKFPCESGRKQRGNDRKNFPSGILGEGGVHFGGGKKKRSIKSGKKAQTYILVHFKREREKWFVPG